MAEQWEELGQEKKKVPQPVPHKQVISAIGKINQPSCQVIFVSNQFYEITQQGEINFIKVVFGLKERNRVNKNKREIT